MHVALILENTSINIWWPQRNKNVSVRCNFKSLHPGPSEVFSIIFLLNFYKHYTLSQHVAVIKGPISPSS